MAFLAVIREGFETAVFLLAAFQSAVSPVQAAIGVVLGIAVAVALGYLVYRGGIKLNLSRFFRITGVVLVLVAAGLVMSTLRAAYEAGWLTSASRPALDLSAIARPGSVQESLLTGMLGIRSSLPVVEVVAYLLYAVPMLLVVLWPPQADAVHGARSAGSWSAPPPSRWPWPACWRVLAPAGARLPSPARQGPFAAARAPARRDRPGDRLAAGATRSPAPSTVGRRSRRRGPADITASRRDTLQPAPPR